VNGYRSASPEANISCHTGSLSSSLLWRRTYPRKRSRATSEMRTPCSSAMRDAARQVRLSSRKFRWRIGSGGTSGDVSCLGSASAIAVMRPSLAGRGANRVYVGLLRTGLNGYTFGGTQGAALIPATILADGAGISDWNNQNGCPAMSMTLADVHRETFSPTCWAPDCDAPPSHVVEWEHHTQGYRRVTACRAHTVDAVAYATDTANSNVFTVASLPARTGVEVAA
jgi:hypothetical protein